MEKIKMTPFNNHDRSAFAGAGENAHAGTFKLEANDPVWGHFAGEWAIVADPYGVGLYCATLEGDDASLVWLALNESLDESFAFIAKNMKPVMTPKELIIVGFEIEQYNRYTKGN